MKIGSLFAGIGGLELGLERAGLGNTMWQVELNPFCRNVLRKHWPNAERFEDVKKVNASCLAPVDIICGGFPCQDVSSAGRGAGIKKGTRSGLWFEFRRIVSEIKPTWVVVENVASGAKRWLPKVRQDLHVLGYGTCAVSISAEDVGAPHLRKRIFVVAYSERVQLREQQRRGGGKSGKGAIQPSNAGPKRVTSDADGMRKLQSKRSVKNIWRRTSDGSWAPPVSPIRGVDDGISNSVERLKALGNAVLPQCAEVIGRMILSYGQ